MVIQLLITNCEERRRASFIQIRTSCGMFESDDHEEDTIDFSMIG